LAIIGKALWHGRKEGGVLSMRRNAISALAHGEGGAGRPSAEWRQPLCFQNADLVFLWGALELDYVLGLPPRFRPDLRVVQLTSLPKNWHQWLPKCCWWAMQGGDDADGGYPGRSVAGGGDSHGSRPCSGNSRQAGATVPMLNPTRCR
jgi:hypothetical protein